MSTLLIGSWTDEHTLTVTESHQVPNGDQEAIGALVAAARDADPEMDWACEFPVDAHRDAVQRAYEEFARDDDADVVDDVEHYAAL